MPECSELIPLIWILEFNQCMIISLYFFFAFSEGITSKQMVVHVSFGNKYSNIFLKKSILLTFKKLFCFSSAKGKQVYRSISKELATNVLSLTGWLLIENRYYNHIWFLTIYMSPFFSSPQPIWVAFTVCSLDSVRLHFLRLFTIFVYGFIWIIQMRYKQYIKIQL